MVLKCFFRLADLSVEFELEKAPGLAELLSVIVNREDVEAVINRPVSRSFIRFAQQLGLYIRVARPHVNEKGYSKLSIFIVAYVLECRIRGEIV
jgi:hypothetical protein